METITVGHDHGDLLSICHADGRASSGRHRSKRNTAHFGAIFSDDFNIILVANQLRSIRADASSERVCVVFSILVVRAFVPEEIMRGNIAF